MAGVWGGRGLDDDARAAAFAALVEALPVGMALLDDGLRYLAVNEILAAINGLPPAEHLGRTVREVFPDITPDAEAALDEALRTGRPSRIVTEAPASVSPDLTRRFEVSYHPLLGADREVRGIITLVNERTDQARASEVLRASERRYRSLVEATTSLVWTVVPGEGIHTDWLEALHPDDQQRIADEWVASVAEGRTFEAEARVIAGSGTTRHVVVRAVPIIEAGEIREWVGSSTDVTAARRAEEEREAAARRTAGLGRVAAALTEALREEDAAGVVLDNAMAALGARGGAVALYDADGETLQFAAARWPADQAARVLSSDLTVERPTVRAARDGVAVFVPDVDELVHEFPAVAELYASLGDQAMTALPLQVHGERLGALALTWGEARTFSDEDQQFLGALAATCAQAIERARLYEREHRVAETLQRALLPERLADPDGIRSAARYLPGTEGVAVGGDWYDLFDLGDRRVGIVLGDVAGKGVAAAAVMGRLRNALRAYATSIDGPADVLAAVDDFADRFGTDDLATIVYAVLDTGTGELRYSSAGHLPPVAIRADGAVGYLDGEPDLPVGVSGPVPRTEHRVRLSTGSTLVFYSDGLVEDRRRSLDEGLTHLVDVLGSAGGRLGAEETCARVVHELVGATGGDDDVAVLVFEWDGPPSADRCSTVLPPVVASARRARALLTEQLVQWGEADLVEPAQLCVSEIVTNAVVHAGTPVRLDIALLDDRVRVEVGDGGAAPPEKVDADDEDVHGRGIAIVELVSAAWGVDPLDDGKCVWFELDRANPPTSGAS